MNRFGDLIDSLKSAKDIPALYKERVSQFSADDLCALTIELSKIQTPESVAFLAQMAVLSGDKLVKKAARKSLYILKTRGLEVPEIREAAPGLYSSPTPLKEEAHVTSVDGNGERMVFIHIPQGPGRGTGMQFLLSDQSGIRDLSKAQMSRRGYNNLVSELANQGHITVIPTTIEQAAGLVERAAAITPPGSQVMNEYAMVKILLTNHSQAEMRPRIYEKIENTLDIRGRESGADPAAILELREFDTWHAEAPEADRWALEFMEADSSRLALNEEQKKERLDQVITEAAREYLSGGRMELIASRLEENAFVLFESGNSDAAEQALWLALEFGKPLDLMRPSARAFAAGLVIRAIVMRVQKSHPA